jgi:DNA-directed RNA polymerase specialized sigma24 family protein
MRITKKEKARQEKDKQLLAVMEQYRELVLKLSWQYWHKLPMAVKSWVDPQDIIEEVYVYVISRAQETYDESRSSRMTFLWTGINNLLLNFAMSHQTQKRFGWSVPLDDILNMGKHDQGLADIEAKEALHNIYKEATPELKEYIAAWFGARRPRVRWSLEARSVYREFRNLALQQRLTRDDCHRLLRSGVWVQE